MANSTLAPEKVTSDLPVTGLTAYSGVFGYAEAAHLLRRATMGVTHSDIQNAVTNGLTATVTQLTTLGALPAPPINYDDNNDPNVPLGSTWIDQPYYAGNGNGKGNRRRSLDAWGMKVMKEEAGISIREKMTLFWHNHFAIEKGKIADAKFRYEYITLLRNNCLGDFKQLVKDITINPAMLRYLDGRINTNNNPNENYAREVLELFTIGKGPQIGPGDYSNYTEDDILELAKVFTGWKDQGYHSQTIAIQYSEFLANKHDTSDKTLSYHFNNAVITNNDADEYKDAIDIIFQQDEVAYFICRKIYRWFVNYDTAPVEATVIEDMAQCLITNNYNIKPVIEALLNSQHFFDAGMRGTMIKNPYEFVFSAIRPLHTIIEHPSNLTPPTLYEEYHVLRKFNDFMLEMNMQYYVPPNVAGWPAYYLEPQFTELWVNSVTIRPRQEFASDFCQNGFRKGSFDITTDVLAFVATLVNPSDPNDLINEISAIIYAQDINQAQKDFLKDILIPGLPDFEWTVEYGNYITNPSDPALAMSVASKLRDLMEAMLNMPEFHLC